MDRNYLLRLRLRLFIYCISSDLINCRHPLAIAYPSSQGML